MLELSAATLHALCTVPRPLTCPRAKVWLRRHSGPVREAAVEALPDIVDALIDALNFLSPSTLTVVALALVLCLKYLSSWRNA